MPGVTGAERSLDPGDNECEDGDTVCSVVKLYDGELTVEVRGTRRGVDGLLYDP